MTPYQTFFAYAENGEHIALSQVLSSTSVCPQFLSPNLLSNTFCTWTRVVAKRNKRKGQWKHAIATHLRPSKLSGAQNVSVRSTNTPTLGEKQTSQSPVQIYRRFGVVFGLHLQCKIIFHAVGSSAIRGDSEEFRKITKFLP